jgi:hypothetical protein
MRIKLLVTLNTILTGILISAALFAGVTSQAEYDPWYDPNDDGYIGIDDIVATAERFGASGDPVGKAYLAYNSGWLNITDLRGQLFNISHDLNLVDQPYIIRLHGKERVNNLGHLKYWYGFGHPGWNKTFGGSEPERSLAMIQTSDGGYALAGDVGETASEKDACLVKTDAYGNVEWNHTYGGPESDYIYSLIQTSDGGYALGGHTKSYGPNVPTWENTYLIKTDDNGVMEWNYTYGGVDNDNGHSVLQTSDGGYAIVGTTVSFGAGGADVYLVKTDASGVMEWNKTYGGPNNDNGQSLVQTEDGGYAIAGYSASFEAQGTDAWLVKTDANGNLLWNHTYGGPETDYGNSLVQTSDGGYAIAGHTSPPYGLYDLYLVKTDGSGIMEWNQTYGGSYVEFGFSLVQSTDGGYAMVGITDSFGAGAYDVILLKIDERGIIEWHRIYGGSDYEFGFSLVQTDDGGYAIAGQLGSPDSDFYLLKTDALGLVNLEWGLTIDAYEPDTLTLFRGIHDPYWNYLRLTIWVVKDTP